MKNDKPCAKCEHCRKVYAQDQWSFWGCYHEPYHGKWIAQIKFCPKEIYDALYEKLSEYLYEPVMMPEVYAGQIQAICRRAYEEGKLQEMPESIDAQIDRETGHLSVNVIWKEDTYE